VIRKAMEAALRNEAKYFLPLRLAELAAAHGLAYQNVTIKNTRTRWGSCSSTNNINLSLHLMRLPAALSDYVLLHELAHIVEKNHGPRFWRYLEKICPGSKALDRQLKAYRIGIF
jgi:predicted metal-dependent hydrolase